MKTKKGIRGSEIPFRAVLWDNDGVLVDTEPLYFEACRQTLAEAGVNLDRERFKKISLEHGRSVLNLARPKSDARPDLIETLRIKREKRYSKLLREGIRIRKGVRETLEFLHGRVRMAVVTSSRAEHFRLIHEQTGLLRYMDVFVTREDTILTKPHPAPYRQALRLLDLPPGECLAVEDSPRGLASARNAGVPCAVIPTPFSRSKNFEGACCVLSSVDELIRPHSKAFSVKPPMAPGSVSHL